MFLFLTTKGHEKMDFLVLKDEFYSDNEECTEILHSKNGRPLFLAFMYKG